MTSTSDPASPDTSRPMREQVEDYIFSLQDSIVSAFEKLDPNAPQFKRDSWLRAQGGKGRSCVFALPADAPATTQVRSMLLDEFTVGRFSLLGAEGARLSTRIV